MLRKSGGPRRAVYASAVVGGLSAAVLAAVLAACSKQPTAVDASYTMPEGTPSAKAQMLLWYDAPNQLTVVFDKPPLGANELIPCHTTVGDGDSVTEVLNLQRAAPGTIFGMIFDGTQSNTYQVFRREGSGGYRRLGDYNLRAAVPWLDGHWALYTFTDTHPSDFLPPTYVGRGTFQGAITPASPLTNVAALTPVTPSDIPLRIACADSCFRFAWDPVPGTERYWIQVYQFRTRPSNLEAVLAGAPIPLYTGLARDFFVGYLEGNQTNYILGDSTRADVTILTYRVPPRSQLYEVRVAAVDAQGRLIAYTKGTPGEITVADGFYGLYNKGACDFTFRPKFKLNPPCAPITAADLAPSAAIDAGVGRRR